MPYTVYILECADTSLYTGCTNDIPKRVHRHNTSPAGAKYTRSRRPVKLVYTENYRTLQRALKREVAIKRLTRKEKLLLIKKSAK